MSHHAAHGFTEGHFTPATGHQQLSLHFQPVSFEHDVPSSWPCDWTILFPQRVDSRHHIRLLHSRNQRKVFHSRALCEVVFLFFCGWPFAGSAS